MKPPFNFKDTMRSLTHKVKENLYLNDKEHYDKNLIGIKDAFTNVINILKQENEFLKTHHPEEAAKLYKHKSALFDALDTSLHRIVEENKADLHIVYEQTKPLEEEFQKLILENKKLLEQSIDMQKEIYQIVIDTARRESNKDNNKNAYNRYGKLEQN